LLRVVPSLCRSFQSRCRLLDIPVLQARNLFSGSYHGVNYVKDLMKEENMKCSSLSQELPICYKETYKEVLRIKVRRRNCEIKDLTKLFLLTESEEDLSLCFTLLQRTVVKDLALHDKYFDLLLWLYMQLCFIFNLPRKASLSWNDPVIRSTGLNMSRSRTSRIYFDLLFINNMYRDVLDTFKKDVDRLVMKHDCVLLTCLACYKIGTKSALEEGLHILGHPALVKEPSNRCYQSIALLAYNCKEHKVAFDLLNKYGSSYIGTKPAEMRPESRKVGAESLTIMLLVEKNWVQEAVMVLEGCVGKHGKLCYIALDKVLDAAKKSRNNNLISKVQNLMTRLQFNHKTIDEDLGARLLNTIEPVGQAKL